MATGTRKTLYSVRRCIARFAVAAFLCAPLVACGGGSGDDDDNGPDAGADTPRGACDYADKVGSFEAQLNPSFTSVQGTVYNAVTPHSVPDVEASTDSPSCRLYRPPSLSCSPACEVGYTCDATGTCIPTPGAVSVGTVTISGLETPIEMTASAPVYYYVNTASLEHPGFDEGAQIDLEATGEGDVAPFTLHARGIAALEVPEGPVQLLQSTSLVLSWTPPGQSDLGLVNINLNIAQHGGTPAWIECDVPDTGELAIPTSLTDQLLQLGFSGFPSVTLTRRSADSTSTSLGCVQLSVQSPAEIEVEIEGLISCSGDEDCPDPLTCQDDLTCG